MTLEEFTIFIQGTGYVDKSGRGAEDLTIDRDNNDPSIGYRIGNISVVTKSFNSHKGIKCAEELHREITTPF